MFIRAVTERKDNQLLPNEVITMQSWHDTDKNKASGKTLSRRYPDIPYILGVILGGSEQPHSSAAN